MAKEEANLFDNENLLVVVPHNALDTRLARAWLQKRGPKVLADGRMIDTLDLLAFNSNQVIMCLFHNMVQSPAGVIRQEDGSLTVGYRPDSELLSEMTQTVPVAVSSCWNRTGGMRAGTIDTSKLIGEINKTCKPYRLYWRDAAAPVPTVLGLELL